MSQDKKRKANIYNDIEKTIEENDLEAIKHLFVQYRVLENEKDRAIYKAIEKNNKDIFSYLLLEQSSKNELSMVVPHFLRTACMKNSTDIIEAIYDNFKEHEYNFKYSVIFDWVTKYGQFSTFKTLLDKGAPFCELDNTYGFVVNLMNDKTDSVEMLNYAITKDKDNKLSYNRMLAVCAEEGKINSLKEILKISAKEKDLSTLFNQKPLSLAAREGHIEIVKLLLTDPQISQYIKINDRNNEAVAYACSSGKLEVVKYLLASSDLKEHADISSNGYRALHWAAESGYVEVLKYILCEMPNKIVLKQEEINALFCEAIESKSIALLQFLMEDTRIEIKPNMSQMLGSMDNLMNRRLIEENPKMVQYLIEKGLDKDIVKAYNNVEMNDWIKMYEAKTMMKKLDEEMKPISTIKNKKKI